MLRMRASRAPYPYRKEEETHEIDFFMVIMASDIARGRVCMTTTTVMRSRKMAATIG